MSTSPTLSSSLPSLPPLCHDLVSIPFFVLVLVLVLLVFLGCAVNRSSGESFLFCIYLPWLIWEGVGCDESDRVNSLLLPSKGLVGTISPFIVNLTSLSTLNLSQNWLSGPIPDGFFMALNRLVIIDISHNRLTGQLSDSDKLMSTVTIVDLSSNHFYGRIQSSFLQPALNLQRFDVSNNSFSGSIPSSVCRFSHSIVHLDFSNNDFVGPILQGFGQCPNLLRLRAGFNNLSGAIPNDIYTVSALQELYLPANKLSGVIDGSIVNLINLRNLSLYGNELSTCLPINSLE
ncbi:unnamed protein product [Fraxinus pennsylvanica]|uniref:Uncharacterized protein n=1 Tax=Fraxinus pennsylvanica TaxID=56036 RepID=A0AAD1YUY3_9LAMI|nr:unnamed protein product [Fraxinus pennsylvanica]